MQWGFIIVVSTYRSTSCSLPPFLYPLSCSFILLLILIIRLVVFLLFNSSGGT